jgi:predicted DNA-binding transcriptional regulator AlpA
VASEGPAESLQLLRIADVCQLLRISKPTFWRLRQQSNFPQPTAVTGRVVAWRRTEIEEWIVARRRSAAPTMRIAESL